MQNTENIAQDSAVCNDSSNLLGLEIVRFASNTTLSKHIQIDPSGGLVKGPTRPLSEGHAYRQPLDSLEAFADLLAGMPSNQALALGRLRSDLADTVQIVTKARLDELKGEAPNVIARIANGAIDYLSGSPALALIDFDMNGMPAEVENHLCAVSGIYEALKQVCDIDNAGVVARSSTSSGLSRKDTGETFKKSGGAHLYVLVKDGSDIPRFLNVLHKRCWLGGFGWLMVSKSGQLLERSIVDRHVAAPERLVFEGAPELEPPLVQDQAARQPTVMIGPSLDTRAACPDLTTVEEAKFSELVAAARHRLVDQAAKARAAYVGRRVKETATSLRINEYEARRTIEKALQGVLLPYLILQFDDPALGEVTVEIVLNNPQGFIGATLADPIEGVAYGRGKAKVLQRADGSLWIHSFAHGRTVYDLRYGHAAVRKAIENAPESEGVEFLKSMITVADLNSVEEAELIKLVAKRAKAGVRQVKQVIEEAKQAHKAKTNQARRDAAAANCISSRVAIPAPAERAERLPVLRAIDEVLVNVNAPEPPMRDLTGWPVYVKVRKPCGFHKLRSETDAGASDGVALPAPDMPLLTRHDRFSFGNLLEEHIEFQVILEGGDSYPVRLSDPFIDSYMRYDSYRLPTAATVVTMPLVCHGSALMAPEGLHRESGVIFRIDPKLRSQLPTPAQCMPETVADAMRFLINDWLCDVSTDFTGKCVLVSILLSILERVLLSTRPAFIITAGQRGGGKTTAIHMVIIAATGVEASAVAWSPSVEERRKAFAAHLSEGISNMVFDNIPRGAVIDCPELSKMLTTQTAVDRKLGATERMEFDTTAIMIFTGNNIAAKGDNCSRMFNARLTVDRPDPENRGFRHPDPLDWTRQHRGEILRAAYTILLAQRPKATGEVGKAVGRFKEWADLVGGPIEYAAGLLGQRISFGEMLLEGEAGDEEAAGTAGVIMALRQWLELTNVEVESEFTAGDVARFISHPAALEDGLEFSQEAMSRQGKLTDIARELRSSLELDTRRKIDAPGDASARLVASKLANRVDAPVDVEGDVWVIRRKPNAHTKVQRFRLDKLGRVP